MELSIDYIFDDAESRVEGLQHKTLQEDGCALFVYDSPTLLKFWMKDVPTDLYLSSIVGGECIESHFMAAMDESVHALRAKTMCVVESRVEIPEGSEVDIVGGKLVAS